MFHASALVTIKHRLAGKVAKTSSFGHQRNDGRGLGIIEIIKPRLNQSENFIFRLPQSFDIDVV